MLHLLSIDKYCTPEVDLTSRFRTLFCVKRILLKTYLKSHLPLHTENIATSHLFAHRDNIWLSWIQPLWRTSLHFQGLPLHRFLVLALCKNWHYLLWWCRGFGHLHRCALWMTTVLLDHVLFDVVCFWQLSWQWQNLAFYCLVHDKTSHLKKRITKKKYLRSRLFEMKSIWREEWYRKTKTEEKQSSEVWVHLKPLGYLGVHPHSYFSGFDGDV